ncbi:UPF0758 domain-containing protein [Escherichia coli]
MKNNSQLLMPREKMLKFGISALTDVELLALFPRTGTRGKDVLTLAKEMLENFGSLYGLLTSDMNNLVAFMELAWRNLPS